MTPERVTVHWDADRFAAPLMKLVRIRRAGRLDALAFRDPAGDWRSLDSGRLWGASSIEQWSFLP